MNRAAGDPRRQARRVPARRRHRAAVSVRWYPRGLRHLPEDLAVRADLDLQFGNHSVTGGTDQPVYCQEWLNAHHFRWDDLAVLKYRSRPGSKAWGLGVLLSDRVPDLTGVFRVDPPFPPMGRSPSVVRARGGEEGGSTTRG